MENVASWTNSECVGTPRAPKRRPSQPPPLPPRRPKEESKINGHANENRFNGHVNGIDRKEMGLINGGSINGEHNNDIEDDDDGDKELIPEFKLIPAPPEKFLDSLSDRVSKVITKLLV